MYDRIEITNGDVKEVINHLKMNGYHFDQADENIIYVLEDETSYVETILTEHGCDFWENDCTFFPKEREE